MKYNINCIYNYYDTLLSEWGEWNRNILVGTFPDGAANLTEALGISTSDGRSRAKELFRIGLLNHELTKGMQALNSIKSGENVQSRFGYIVALLYQAHEKNGSPTINRAIAAINAIFSIVQPFEIDGFSISVNSVVHRLLESFPVPEGNDRITWLRYLISGFCCELKEARSSTTILDFLQGRQNQITLRIIDNKTGNIRSSFSNVDELKKCISSGISLTNIHHQKMALFMLGSAKDVEPRGFYGIADKYFPEFLNSCYLIEKDNLSNSPFKGLYYDDESTLCQKSNIIETFKNVCSKNTELSKSYSVIMKSIEEGAIEALMYMSDKPKSAFVSSWKPSEDMLKDGGIMQYLIALQTKPFMLLAGISGTGKSRIVREFAFKTCPKYLQDKDGTTPGNYCMIEVKPNWHDSTELLGYYSNLTGSYQYKKFVKFLVKAMLNPDVPFFVCLDEMNLAPVEQYFAEILSILETRKHPKMKGSKEDDMTTIKTGAIIEAKYFKYTWKDADGNTHVKEKDMSDKEWYDEFFNLDKLNEEEKAQVSKFKDSYILANEGLSLPDNVFIIGTVNMDDTTHQFSRKVIDRAMTIEMNGGRLADMYGGSRKLEYIDDEKELKEWQEACVQHYVTADEVLDAHPNEAGKIISVLPERLEEINKALKGTPFEVSYRVLNELTIMVGVMLDSKSEDDSFDNIVNQAINNILLMKILPRIEGDAEMFALSKDYKNKMGISYNDRLEWLLNLAPDLQKKQDNEVPDSEGDTVENDKESELTHQQTAKEKIQEMIYRLSNQEFTRFWP
jgi:hypothetical protein